MGKNEIPLLLSKKRWIQKIAKLCLRVKDHEYGSKEKDFVLRPHITDESSELDQPNLHVFS